MYIIEFDIIQEPPKPGCRLNFCMLSQLRASASYTHECEVRSVRQHAIIQAARNSRQHALAATKFLLEIRHTFTVNLEHQNVSALCMLSGGGCCMNLRMLSQLRASASYMHECDVRPVRQHAFRGSMAREALEECYT